MRELLPIIRDHLGKGRPLALATLISRKGSAPREQGARLLATAAGLAGGTIGGGEAEAAVLKSCGEVLRTGGSRLLDLSLTNAAAAEEGMVCGGNVRVLVEALLPSSELRDFFDAVAAASRVGEGVFLTRLVACPESLHGRIVYAGGAVTGAFPGAVWHSEEAEALQAALRTSDPLAGPGVFSCNGRDYFAEPLSLPCRMIIAGAGHIAVPTAELAVFAGFSVYVFDDRPEFAQAERFPKADSVTVVPEFVDCLVPFSPDPQTYIVIVTRGHKYDGTVLAQALRTGAGYVGMIGSRRKRETVYAVMREEGFGDADLGRVHCPLAGR